MGDPKPVPASTAAAGCLPVDRSRFLLLTAALAVSACGRQQPSDAPPQGGFDTTAGDYAPGQSGGDDPGTAVVEIAPPEAEPEAEAAASSDDDSVDVPDCKLVRDTGPQCEAMGGRLTSEECAGAVEALDPHVAEVLVECLIRKSHRGKCGQGMLKVCPQAALESVRGIDHDAIQRCAGIDERCRDYGRGTSVDGCRRLMQAVKPDYRDRAISCVAEGCTPPEACMFIIGW